MQLNGKIQNACQELGEQFEQNGETIHSSVKFERLMR